MTGKRCDCCNTIVNGKKDKISGLMAKMYFGSERTHFLCKKGKKDFEKFSVENNYAMLDRKGNFIWTYNPILFKKLMKISREREKEYEC